MEFLSSLFGPSAAKGLGYMLFAILGHVARTIRYVDQTGHFKPGSFFYGLIFWGIIGYSIGFTFEDFTEYNWIAGGLVAFGYAGYAGLDLLEVWGRRYMEKYLGSLKK